MSNKIYPIGIQSFEKIRRNGYFYIDKTALIYRLVKTGSYYFLSRPRRFGKSLLISTLEAYFSGVRELFEGLALEQLEKEWKKHPVLHLDLNIGKYDTPHSLDDILNKALLEWEAIYGTGVGEVTLALRFAGVVERAYKKTGEGVVILVDEYDKPMLQAIGERKLQVEFRSTLKSFYSVLKTMDRYIRFALLTGVTKFGKVSVFSDLNNLNDISMYEPFVSICGMTEKEIHDNLEEDLYELAAMQKMTYERVCAELKECYDGYHFVEDSEGIYNPFSVLNACKSKILDNFWFQTGTPTYLVNLLKESDYDLRLLIEGVEVTASAFFEYRAEVKNPLPMIYQSGYLTIKDYDRDVLLYTLGFPNDEVRYGFLNFLVPYYTGVTDDETGFHIAKFMRELRSGDVDAFMERLKVFFAGIPYELSNNTERHYQAIFYVVFTLLGQFVQAEVRSARGRADAVVQTKDAVYVFEFKLNGSAEDALKQIDERGYLIPYVLDGRRLVKVGVNFSKETRNVERYIVE